MSCNFGQHSGKVPNTLSHSFSTTEECVVCNAFMREMAHIVCAAGPSFGGTPFRRNIFYGFRGGALKAMCGGHLRKYF